MPEPLDLDLDAAILALERGEFGSALPFRNLDALLALIARLRAAEADEAVCHCGIPLREHSLADGHGFVEMRRPCPFEARLRAAEAALEHNRSVAVCAEHVDQVVGDGCLVCDLAAARREALEQAAERIESEKNGYTCDLGGDDLRIVPDRDGPWFLKSHMAALVRALAAAPPPEPAKEEPVP